MMIGFLYVIMMIWIRKSTKWKPKKVSTFSQMRGKSLICIAYSRKNGAAPEVVSTLQHQLKSFQEYHM